MEVGLLFIVPITRESMRRSGSVTRVEKGISVAKCRSQLSEAPVQLLEKACKVYLPGIKMKMTQNSLGARRSIVRDRTKPDSHFVLQTAAEVR